MARSCFTGRRDRAAAAMGNFGRAAFPTGPIGCSCLPTRGAARCESVFDWPRMACVSRIATSRPGRRPHRDSGHEASLKTFDAADGEGVSADIPVSGRSRDVGVRGPYRVVNRWSLRHFVEHSQQFRTNVDHASPALGGAESGNRGSDRDVKYGLQPLECQNVTGLALDRLQRRPGRAQLEARRGQLEEPSLEER